MMEIVKVEDGMKASAINEPGTWYGAVGRELLEKDHEITLWLMDAHANGMLGEAIVNYLDIGRVYFKREEDLMLFVMRWS